VYFEVLRACGALAVVFPEIERLWGVPQPAKWHPEIDTGVHTMLVLREAARLSAQPRIRYAALVHDLGKGTTPPDRWPRHHGHEERSVQLVHAMADRLRIPNDFRELAVATARWHGLCHRALELRPSTVLELLEHLDAFRRAERFAEFLLACEADIRGRTGLETRPYPQANYLRAAQAAAAAAALTPAERERYAGPAYGEQLRKKRTAAIAAVPRAA
jgi:tRNA nucleotidyltransferase (CCA-adding enzyme)